MRGTVSMKRWRVTSALVAALAVGLVGCAADPLAEQYRSGDDKGFIAGDFRVVEIPVAQRGEAVRFSGETETGAPVSSDDFVGDVLVVNFWYAGCGPCRAEAPDLQKAYGEFTADDVAFLGVNTVDAPETAIAFAENYGITYPSAMAADNGAIKLAFAERTPINATPTTLVLDSEGRVAARIIGQLEDASILTTLVRDTLAEQP